MKLAQRISVALCETESNFVQLLEFLRRHRAAADEVALMTDSWYGYQPMAEVERIATLLADRIPRLRAAGIRNVGVNVICTMGFDHVWDFIPAMPFPPMVGHDGTASKNCPCPNSPDFRKYLRQRYTLFARSKPDFIWVDDDVRMHHHGMGGLDFVCFCPICVKRFTHGRCTSRAALIAKLNAPDGGAWRQRWISNNVRVIDDLLRLIERAVHRVDPGIELGLMTAGVGWSTYTGHAYETWMKTLGGRRMRPGGGFFTDVSPSDMLKKAWEIGRQCHAYPPSADNIQYELENYPCTWLGKSVQVALDECLLALAVGCNGIAFNTLPFFAGALDDYAALLRGVARERPLWERFVQAAACLPMVGFWPVHDRQLMARRPVADGNWFMWESATPYAIGAPEIHGEIGLPLTTYPESACGVFLSNRLAEVFSNRDLRRFLSHGAVIDGPTLQILWDRGLGELTGVRPGKQYETGVREVPSDHPLNGCYAGDERELLAPSWKAVALELVPVDRRAETLSHLLGYDGTPIGAGLTLYENKLGGRVATLGFNAWAFAGSTGKRTQLLNIADWVSRGTVPLRIDRTLKVVPFVRMSPDRKRFVVVLLNASLDPTGAFSVRLRVKATAVQCLKRDGVAVLPAAQREGELVVRLPQLGPWQTVVLKGM